MRRMRVLAETTAKTERKFQFIGKGPISRDCILRIVCHAARAGGSRAASSTCSPAPAFMNRIPTPITTSGHIVPDLQVRKAARTTAAFITACF